MRPVSRLLFAAILLWTSAAARGQEIFDLPPEGAKVGEQITVKFKENVGQKNAIWAVSATQNGAAVSPGEVTPKDADGLVTGNLATVAKAQANTRYTFAVSFIRGAARDEEQWVILLEFDAAKLAKREIKPPGGSEAAAPSPVAPAPTISPVSPPPPAASGKETIQDQLAAAKAWAEEVAKLAKTDNLVVPVDFFKAALDKRREYPREDGLMVAGTLKKRMLTPLADAAAFYRATDNTLKSQPADAPAAILELAWAAEKERFIAALVDVNHEAKSTARLWREFLDEWQAEAKRVAPARFRDALMEAPLVLTAILLGYEKEHIQNAMTGGGPRGAAVPTVTTATGIAGYGVSHAYAHHVRTMSRIEYRHERRLARIGAY